MEMNNRICPTVKQIWNVSIRLLFVVHLLLPTKEFRGQVVMIASSVTRFGEISPFWQKFTNLWQIFDGLFFTWQIYDIFGLIVIAANG